MKKLCIVTCLSNADPVRALLFKQFMERMRKSDAYAVHAIELLKTGQSSVDKNSQVVHSDDVLWHKENLLELAIDELPPNWENVAWLDCDVAMTNPDWVAQTVQLLEQCPVVQLFREALDLGPQFEVLKKHTSFADNWCRLGYVPETAGQDPDMRVSNHPGYGWAMTRRAYAECGLFDKAIVGGGDKLMALSFVGALEEAHLVGLTDEYNNELCTYQYHALRASGERIGVLNNTLLHYWHGSKTSRKYTNRWSILRDNQYKPSDLDYDEQGVLKWVGNEALQEAVAEYMGQRSSDTAPSESDRE